MEHVLLVEQAAGLDASLKPALAYLYVLDLMNADRLPGFQHSDAVNHTKSTLTSSNGAAMVGNSGLELIKQVLRQIAPNARVISGPEAVSAAALSAVKQYVYKPALLNRNPAVVLTTVKVEFSLQVERRVAIDSPDFCHN